MIILIGGGTHTGKTNLSQRLLERYKYPYLSIDHLKMGLIRSGYADMTPEDDEKIIMITWPILVEIIKTAIENNQNLIIEGCYIPYDWKKSFEGEYRDKIRDLFLIFTANYIEKRIKDIEKYKNIVERRCDDIYCNIEELIKENNHVLQSVKKHGCNYILIDKNYCIESMIKKIGIN